MEVNIEKIKSFSAITIFLAIFSVLIPGFLFLFVFKKNFFYNSDFFRLSVIAISITLPVVIINIFFSLLANIRQHVELDNEEQFHFLMSGSVYYSAVLSTAVIYLTILSGYLLNLTIKQALIVTTIAEALVVVYLYFDSKPEKQKNK